MAAKFQDGGQYRQILANFSLEWHVFASSNMVKLFHTISCEYYVSVASQYSLPLNMGAIWLPRKGRNNNYNEK